MRYYLALLDSDIFIKRNMFRFTNVVECTLPINPHAAQFAAYRYFAVRNNIAVCKANNIAHRRCIYSYASTQQRSVTACYAPLKRSARGAICASVLDGYIAISSYEIISLFCNVKQYRAPKVHILLFGAKKATCRSSDRLPFSYILIVYSTHYSRREASKTIRASMPLTAQ